MKFITNIMMISRLLSLGKLIKKNPDDTAKIENLLNRVMADFDKTTERSTNVRLFLISAIAGAYQELAEFDKAVKWGMKGLDAHPENSKYYSQATTRLHLGLLHVVGYSLASCYPALSHDKRESSAEFAKNVLDTALLLATHDDDQERIAALYGTMAFLEFQTDVGSRDKVIELLISAATAGGVVQMGKERCENVSARLRAAIPQGYIDLTREVEAILTPAQMSVGM